MIKYELTMNFKDIFYEKLNKTYSTIHDFDMKLDIGNFYSKVWKETSSKIR